MNCVKCGALLEEGSTSTLCATCQALEVAPQQVEKPLESAPVESAPVESAPTDIPVPPSNLESQPTAENDTPTTPEDKPEDLKPPTIEIQ